MRTHPNRLLTLAAAVACAVLPACKDSTGSKTGPAAQVAVVSGNTQTGPVLAELPQPLVVKVTDAQGRAVKGQVVSFVVTAGGGHAAAGTVTTDAQGLAQGRWTLGGVAGAPQTLEARAVNSNTGQVLAFTTFTATATPGAPAQAAPYGPSAFSGDTVVAGVAGSVVEDSFAVIVRDAGGNPVPGAQVAWAVTTGGGSITTPTTTDAAGVARTQWVLGAYAGPQTAQATVAGTTLRFTAYPADQLVIVSGNGQIGSAGNPIGVIVGAKSSVMGPVIGLPIRWTATSGGGSVSPAVSTTERDFSGYLLAISPAQWTLGAPGPQTLTASAGNLSVTFTATALTAGTRTLLGQVPGAVLDATADRVLWMDGATRVIKVRTLSNGADATVKTDTVKGSLTWTVSGHLYTGGALLWNSFFEMFDWRGGTPAYLGRDPNRPPKVDADWASYYLDGTGLIRRNLAAATTAVIPGGTSISDVGPDGTLVYPSGGSLFTVTPGGATSSAPTQAPSCGGLNQVFTDGVSAGYICLNTFGMTMSGWISKPGGDDYLTGLNYAHGGSVVLILAGGWAAYANTSAGTVGRRAPDGTKTQLNGASKATLMALSPSGAVVYAMNGQYFKITANGTTLGEGPAAQGERVVWRGDRFILIAGSSLYDLGS